MECKKANIKTQAEIDILEIDKKALFHKDKLDLKTLEEVIKKIAQLKGDSTFLCIKAMSDAKNVLTEEQRAKLKELIKSCNDCDMHSDKKVECFKSHKKEGHGHDKH